MRGPFNALCGYKTHILINTIILFLIPLLVTKRHLINPDANAKNLPWKVRRAQGTAQLETNTLRSCMKTNCQAGKEDNKWGHVTWERFLRNMNLHIFLGITTLDSYIYTHQMSELKSFLVSIICYCPILIPKYLNILIQLQY